MSNSVKYAVMVDGKMNSLVSTKEAGLLCIQAIAQAVAKDVVIKMVEVHDFNRLSLAAKTA